MNAMQDFYASISSVSKPQGSYLEALAKISRLNRGQMESLASDLGWQIWGEQDKPTASNS